VIKKGRQSAPESETKGPLTRIASRIAKGNSGQSDLSPRGEELAPVAGSSPLGEKVAA